MSTVLPSGRAEHVLEHLRSERWSAAELAARQLLAEDSDDADAHHHLAIALWRQGRIDEARQAFERTFALRPEHAQALANCSLMLAQAGGPPGSLAICRRAVEANPGNLDLLNDLGIVQFAEGLLEESIASYNAALWIAPDAPVPTYNRNFPRLLLGDFRGHCADYEARFAGSGLWPSGAPNIDNLPLWRGESITGRNLLVHAEQGFGDTLQYIRFIPLLASLKPARLTVHVQPEVLPALQSLRYFAELLPVGSVVGPCHFSVPLLSLPHRLGTDWATLPAWSPYLAPQGERVAYWARRLDQLERAADERSAGARPPAVTPVTRPLRVGLVWRGAAANVRDRERSLSLRELHLLAQPGIRFISLQKGPAAQEAREDTVLCPLPLGEELVDFGDTAALISQLDLVVSVDTAVAHLAGALGHPTWILSTRADVKWLVDRTDSPWYPSVRLFRQKQRGEWKSAVVALAYELQQSALRRLREPGQVDALRDAARTAQASGDLQEAGRLAWQALQRDPTRAELHAALASVRQAEQRPLEALCGYRQALARDPGLGSAHAGIARLLRERSCAPEALEHHRRVLAAEPGNAAALEEHAQSCLAANDPLGALRWAGEALRLGHGDALAMIERCLALLGEVLPELRAPSAAWLAVRTPDQALALAEALLDVGLPLPAVAFYRLALQAGPAAAALRGLSDCLLAQQEWPALAELVASTAQLLPDDQDLRCDHATALWKLGQLDASEALFAALLHRAPHHTTAQIHGSALALARRAGATARQRAQAATTLAPTQPEAWLALAAVHEWHGDVEGARTCLQHVLRLQPDHALAQFNLATLDLLEGHWARGWAGYEARADAEGVRQFLGARSEDAPRWRGEDLSGMHLVVCAEQGLGDTLQFLRFTQELGRWNPARVTLQVQDPLVGWLRQEQLQGRLTIPGVPLVEVMPRSLPLPPYQRFVPLLSLPGVLGADTGQLPAPWLPAADPQRTAHWRAWLDSSAGTPRVGVCWAGNPAFARDRDRSLTLDQLAPLFAQRGCSLVSLQYGPAGDAAAGHGARIPNLSPALGFADTAALVSALDLVISCDTAVAHLAAGLGVPTWVLVPKAADWRWGRHGADCGWYPSVRVFRQRTPGQWDSVIDEVCSALRSGY